MTITEALDHEWFSAKLVQQPQIDYDTVKSIIEFRNESKALQTMKIKMANVFLSKENKASEINKKFQALDKEGNGMISSADLINVLESQG